MTALSVGLRTQSKSKNTTERREVAGVFYFVARPGKGAGWQPTLRD